MGYPTGGFGGGMAPEQFGSTLRNVAPVIIGLLIMIIVAVVVMSIAGGMGYYILGVMNKSGVTIPAKVNFLQNAIGIIPGAVTLLVIMVFIGIVSIMIILMAKASKSFTESF